MAAFAVLFLIEGAIAIWVHDRFVRPYMGDVLVVVLVYCFVRIFRPEGIRHLPAYVFLSLIHISGMEGVRQLLVGKAAHIFQEKIGFRDQLHVGVFNAVVDHFYIMSGAIRPDVGAAGFSHCPGRNGFQDGTYGLIGLPIASGHDGWTESCSFFPSGNAHTQIVDPFFFQFPGPSHGCLLYTSRCV